METSVVEATVRVVEAERPPDDAVIVVVPEATAVARPVAAIVATLLLDDDQATDAVRSCVVLSEKVPVALNC